MLPGTTTGEPGTPPAALRALAHPVRLAILDQLRLRGQLSASQLGAHIGESPANCSWHLRKLAEHGFVVEAGNGVGRARPWRVSPPAGPSQPAADSVDGGARQLLARVLVDREVARFADNEASTIDPGWAELHRATRVAPSGS